jgi:hypothetical protein
MFHCFENIVNNQVWIIEADSKEKAVDILSGLGYIYSVMHFIWFKCQDLNKVLNLYEINKDQLNTNNYWYYPENKTVETKYGDYCLKCNDYNDYVEYSGCYTCFGCRN